MANGTGWTDGDWYAEGVGNLLFVHDIVGIPNEDLLR